MSRSRKKNPIHGNAVGTSEKQDKKILHGIERSNQREVLDKIKKEVLDSDEANFYTAEEALDIWNMSKDGKSYWHEDPMFPRNKEWWDEYREKAMRK